VRKGQAEAAVIAKAVGIIIFLLILIFAFVYIGRIKDVLI